MTVSSAPKIHGPQLSPAQKNHGDALFKLLKIRRSKEGDSADKLTEFCNWALPRAPLSQGQLFQDLWVLWELCEKRNGYFCEFGATDGLDLSNSYLLEKAFGWSGVLAEPNPNYHAGLAQNRDCTISYKCVYSESGKMLPFLCASLPQLSRLIDVVPEDSHEIVGRRHEAQRVDVETISLNDLLAEANAPDHIDYMSLDTEGSEFMILEQFDFDRRSVGMLSVEHNNTPMRDQVFDLLSRKGFVPRFREFSQYDDWYIHGDFLHPAPLPRASDISHQVAKAAADDFTGRFREIVSDPLNTLIHRHPEAGTLRGSHVVLHNGIEVPVSGSEAYYDNFSDILQINRGVHEPLEEYAFQEVLPHLPTQPVMLELGAYWGHYSMWLQRLRPQAQLHLVEPDLQKLNVGKSNFVHNNCIGEFTQALVGKGLFEVDSYLTEAGITHLHILHADIQGAETEMLQGAAQTLRNRMVDYLFVSTHGQQRHNQVINQIEQLGYRIELAADDARETTSFDGFILAVCPKLPVLFQDWTPLGRQQILRSTPAELLASLMSQVYS